MTAAQRRYVLIETLVSAAINTVLSIVFVFLLFGGQRAISVPALIVDALPQSFMIGLMAFLVPTLLTARRMRAGAVAPTPDRAERRLHPAVAAVATALVAAIVAGAAQWALLPHLLPGEVPFAAVLVGKAIYGALLGAGITVFALRRALATAW